MALTSDLSSNVRSSCGVVMQTAEHVRLNPEGLDLVARELSALPIEQLPGPIPTLNTFDESEAIRSLAANAINFGSGYHDVVRKEPGMSGARTMLWRLMRYLDATGPLDASRLRRITIEDSSQIFGQELDGGALEQLMSRFTVGLNDLGTFLDDNGGTALAVLVQCGHSAVVLAELLTEMPFYRDVESHNGLPISFYKRAQITPADLYRGGIWKFSDLSELTAFADNLVPHVLRLDGAIEVDDAIVSFIERGELLEPGSRAEVELRAAAVIGVEELVQRVDDPRVWPMHVDEWLWERGGGSEYKAVRRPRSRSVFY